MRRFLFSELMAQVARAALGDTVYLFNEQYVVKAAERGMKFGWHQDSGFIPYRHSPYLTCWIALDDVSEANGTVYLLPYARAGTREVVQHVRDEETNDMIGYFGDDRRRPGDHARRKHRLLLEHGLSPQRPEHDRSYASRLRRPVLRRTDPRPRSAHGRATSPTPLLIDGERA